MTIAFVTRNAIVAALGTPSATEGSLNDPREREEMGLRFNEKWVYSEPVDDPSGAAERVVYWHRYDFIASYYRPQVLTQWRLDDQLPLIARRIQEQAQSVGLNPVGLIERNHRADEPLPPLDPAHNPPLEPSAPYRPVSEVKDPLDLGGHIQ